jgi:hypothetical protein
VLLQYYKHLSIRGLSALLDIIYELPVACINWLFRAISYSYVLQLHVDSCSVSKC